MRWVFGHIAEQVVDAAQIFEASPIQKATLTFKVKFWWAIMRSHLYITVADNHLTLDHAIMVAYMMASYQIDFTGLIVEIHERAFRGITTVLFFLDNQLVQGLRDTNDKEVDDLLEVKKTQDVVLIKDTTNLTIS